MSNGAYLSYRHLQMLLKPLPPIGTSASPIPSPSKSGSSPTNPPAGLPGFEEVMSPTVQDSLDTAGGDKGMLGGFLSPPLAPTGEESGLPTGESARESRSFNPVQSVGSSWNQRHQAAESGFVGSQKAEVVSRQDMGPDDRM